MKLKIAVLGLFLTGLTACQSAPEQTISESVSCVIANAGNYQAVLNDVKNGWSECFDHNQTGLFASVVERIGDLANQQDVSSNELDTLLYYLRAFSYYGDIKTLSENDWQQLNTNLQLVVNMPNAFSQSATALRLQEHIAVTMYQYGWQDNSLLDKNLVVKTQVKLLAQVDVANTKQAANYQALETYRAIGFLAYQARGKKALKAAMINPDNGLVDSVSMHLLSLTNNDWHLSNTVWATANLHYLLPEEKQKTLDKQVTEYVFNQPNLSSTEQKQLFSQNYLVNSFRYHEQCADDFKDQCLIPNIDQVLPVNHVCSDTLFIRATAMTDTQLADTCRKLTSQETFFHQTINSKNVPVSNDGNTKLRVVIFDNYSEYNRWGQLLFNIGTDNGGMYIEGQPEKSGNQATFYSFEAYWHQPSFSIWNLNHEYVHYLDGRFVKYGTFGHYPSHLVWWSEGLAEYISVQKQNKKAFALLNKTPQKDWPTLAQIFATSYNDGTDRVYRWSYQAIRFIFENYPAQGQAMAAALKADNFEQYQNALTTFANAHQSAFLSWQLSNQPKKAAVKKPEDAKKSYKAKPLYRYLYRTYLRPEQLPITPQHKHFSNWG